MRKRLLLLGALATIVATTVSAIRTVGAWVKHGIKNLLLGLTFIVLIGPLHRSMRAPRVDSYWSSAQEIPKNETIRYKLLIMIMRIVAKLDKNSSAKKVEGNQFTYTFY